MYESKLNNQTIKMSHKVIKYNLANIAHTRTHLFICITNYNMCTQVNSAKQFFILTVRYLIPIQFVMKN